MPSTSAERTDYTALWDLVYGGKANLALMINASRFRVRKNKKYSVIMTFITDIYSISTTFYGFRKEVPTACSGIYTLVRKRKDRTMVDSVSSFSLNNHREELERILGKSLSF